MLFDFLDQRAILVQNEWQRNAFWALLCHGKRLLLEASCQQHEYAHLNTVYYVHMLWPSEPNGFSRADPELQVAAA